MNILDKTFKNKNSISASIEQNLFGAGYHEKTFGVELFTFQYWHDKMFEYNPYIDFNSITVRLTIFSICLRVHYYYYPNGKPLGTKATMKVINDSIEKPKKRRKKK